VLVVASYHWIISTSTPNWILFNPRVLLRAESDGYPARFHPLESDICWFVPGIEPDGYNVAPAGFVI
jgi:hypothetical protein